MAITALTANKLRSLLTMLGIIIGVGAVIAMVSVGMGVRKNITDSIASLGSNMLIVMPGSSNRGGPRGAAGSMQTLKYDDAVAIKKKIKNIDYVSPTVSSSYQIVNGNQNWNSSVQGVIPEYMSIQSDLLSLMTTCKNEIESQLSERQLPRICLAMKTLSAKIFESIIRRLKSSEFWSRKVSRQLDRIKMMSLSFR